MPSDRARDQYRLIMAPVLVPSFLFAVGTGAMTPVLVLAALQLGASEAFASAIIALSAAVALVVTVPVGMTIDRIGDRRAMVVATASASVLLGVTIVVLAFPTRWSLALYVAALMLRTPAVLAWGLARQAVVAETVAASFRGQAMTALGGTMRAGNLVGPLVSAVLLLWLPMWSVFAFAAITAALATGLLFIPALTSTFDAQTERSRASHTDEEIALRVNWQAVRLAGVAVLTLAVGRVAQPIITALWGLRLGWTESQIALAVAVGAAVELLLMLPGGYLKDRLGRSPVLALCLAVYGAGFVLAPLWPTSVGFVVAIIIMSIGNGLGSGINMTIGADLSPVVGRARFLSIWAMFTQAGMLGGPLAISGLLLVASLPAAVASVGGLAVVGAVWTLVWAPVTKLPRGIGRPPPGRDLH